MSFVEAEFEGFYHYSTDCFCLEEGGLLRKIAFRTQETTIFQNFEILYFTHFLALACGHFGIFFLDWPQVQLLVFVVA